MSKTVIAGWVILVVGTMLWLFGYFTAGHPSFELTCRDMKSAILVEWPEPKSVKVQIKRQKVSLGWAYRIYIDGHIWGPA